MNGVNKKRILLTLVSGILLDVPALIIFLTMLLFKIHYFYFCTKSYLFVMLLLNLSELFITIGELFFILFLVLIPLLFYLFNIHLFSGKEKIPFKSVCLFLIIFILEAVYYFFSVRPGLLYQGKNFFISSVILNSVFISAQLILFYRNLKKPSFMNNLVFNFLLIFWAVWFAFPFFGEMGF